MTLTNQFAALRITGTWAEHLGRGSAGGIDYPVGYGTAIAAPAAGRITNRRWWGSAGHIVTLSLDEPVATPAGAIRAVQFFHLSAHVAEGHVERGQTIGYSGASANGELYGGDIHVHTNGLTAVGTRIDWIPYAGGSAQAGTPNQEEDDMYTDKDRKRDDDMAWNVKQIKRTLDDANGFVTSEDGKTVTKVAESIRGRFDRILSSLEGGFDASGKNNGKGIRAMASAIKTKLGA